MGVTSNGLPYPEPGASVDVPRDIRALAVAVNPYAQLQAVSRYLGSTVNPALVTLGSAFTVVTPAFSVTPARSILQVSMNLGLVNNNSGGGKTATVSLRKDGTGQGQFATFLPLVVADNPTPQYAVSWVWTIPCTPGVSTSLQVYAMGSVASAVIVNPNGCAFTVVELP